MNEPTPSTPPAALPQGLAALTELAMDLRWTWNHCSDELWRRLDPELWERTRHPSAVLQMIAREKLTAALADPGFRQLLDRLVQANRRPRPPGSSRNIPRRSSPASPIFAWSSC
jgi:hypothetical protein